ncbi:sugar ABC transporter substrate-binding protein [Clostridium sp. AM58-1XD]|uniref:sugar ABC transporter substrate-binding protein n=1 Tax=Clostridium sp. AM58-1XD TaxID=2292307 RepID=UPI000E4D5627|nr:sugar ABC transporter substrate-binding protein [Clostridium sp. AM58-1XD]RGY98213.1 sugar ABC transporter substrate-binding protein [Clostridium sp. AM58-1XD]
MRRKVLATALAAVMVLTLGACSSGEKKAETTASGTTAEAGAETTEKAAEETTDSKSSDEKGKLIGISVADQSNVFYVDILAGMEEAKQDGDEFVIMDAGFDAAKQMDDIEDMITQGVQVMLIDPVDSNAIKTSLDACNKAGIPIICYNSPVAADLAEQVDSTVATDNVMAGNLAGEAMAKGMGEKGKVALLTYNVAEVTADRANGFMDVLKKYPDIEIVEQQEIEPGTDTALPVAENILQAYPDLTGFFAINDPSALGIVAAAETAGMLDQLTIVGVDGSEEAKASIKEGKMYASAAQYPKEIGKISIETAYKVLNGETVEKDTKVDSGLIDASNAE